MTLQLERGDAKSSRDSRIDWGPSEDGFGKTQQTENSALKMGINWWPMDINTLYVSHMQSTTDPLLFRCSVANSGLTLW